jgi:hypothetical protein
MEENNLVVLKNTGKINPFSFGTLQTLYLQNDQADFDYTNGGEFEILVSGVRRTEFEYLRRTVPVQFYLIHALGQAHVDGKLDTDIFFTEFHEFKRMLLTGELRNSALVSFDPAIPLPPLAFMLIGAMSSAVDSLGQINIKTLSGIDIRFVRTLGFMCLTCRSNL